MFTKGGSPGGQIFKAVSNLLFVFLLAELTSRAFLSVGSILEHVKGTDDSSLRLAWVKRHEGGRTFTYSFDVYDPVRGWAVKPGLLNVSVFGNKILNSNSRGLRGSAEYDYARKTGQHRIVVLGDSYTFGDEVSDAETYSSDLGTLLPDTEVLNLGVHGYGQDQMLLYFKEEGMKYAVVLGYVWFDMNRNLLSFNDFAKPRYKLERKNLRLTSVPVPSPEEVLNHEFFRLKLLDLLLMVQGRVRWHFGWNQQEAENVAAAILDELLVSTRQIGAVPVLVYLPVLQELADTHEGLTRNEEFLNRFCRERRVPCLFLRPSFIEEVKKGANFNTRSHWLAPEHSLAARAIASFLMEKNIIKAQEDVPTSSLR